MMKSTDARERDYLAGLDRLYRSGIRGALVQRRASRFKEYEYQAEHADDALAGGEKSRNSSRSDIQEGPPFFDHTRKLTIELSVDQDGGV